MYVPIKIIGNKVQFGVMDGLSLHLPPVIPDSYYDISNHSSGYQPFQTPTAWVTRDESVRGYHQSQTNDYDTTLRFHGNSDRQNCTIVGSVENLEPTGTEEHSDETRETGIYDGELMVLGSVTLFYVYIF